MKTHLKYADIEMQGENRVLVVTRNGGTPSSPQPTRQIHYPRVGQTVEQLYNELVAEWLDENGE